LYGASVTRKTNEKALRETKTLRAGCSKVEPKIITLPQTPFPGVQDSQNLISWRRSLQTQFGEDQCMQFRVIMVTDTPTHPPTHTHTHTHTHTDGLQYIALQLAHSVTS